MMNQSIIDKNDTKVKREGWQSHIKTELEM